MTWLSLGSLLQKHISDSPVRRGVAASVIVGAANIVLAELFSKAITEQFQATYFKNGALFVACISATAAQELRLNEEDFKAKINARLGQTLVRRIAYLM